MEFHINRSVRERLELDDLLFSYTGNVVFANVAASRTLAAKLNAWRQQRGHGAEVVNAGKLFAMGLIDELSHAMIARYRRDIDPAVLKQALDWFAARVGKQGVDKLLSSFTMEFPNTTVFRHKLTPKEWLAGATEDLSHREAALEELMLLWLANLNPAFKEFKELFSDEKLRLETPYRNVTAEMPTYFKERPPASPEGKTLFEVLREPAEASPDNVIGQLDYIREHWPKYLGEDMRRVLLAIDTVREEDVAIWMRFHPPGPSRYDHGEGWEAHGYVGDEFVGYDDMQEWVVGADGVRRRKVYSGDYQAPLNEYEAFSADYAWMPTVIMMAKSTYVWLEQLSQKYQRHIHRLDQIPEEELALLQQRGMTALWLIGLWERSVASQTIKRLRGNPDAVASAYSLKEYDIAADLGGNAAYEALRDRAARYGIRLASDMVPNHMGIDSNWVIEHPDWFVERSDSPFPVYSFEGPDLSTDSRVEIKIEDHYYDQTDAAVAFRLRSHREGWTKFIYHGNDGTTFAWNDTAQLDYSKAYVREQVMQTILHVARLFPIIRFDAAMVLAKRHVQRLWFPLPGVGGSIPSRAEYAMSQEEFDAMMPLEFWREVVDRVAVEVPGTLLLAEAFWLLEGYFVRTLGMHRVYNSAFMNMLRDEENAKYRSYLKKTVEFDPDIMKRYVNFMSNPDEKTAAEQFGGGDKYFGTCTLLATLPGLPMFAHGQIEGFTERYGMDFKQARMQETPNQGFMDRYQREIVPLLKDRHVFAESEHFLLYDLWNEHGTVDENVIVYSNRSGEERALVVYNNLYQGTRGTIHVSVGYMDKGSGEMRQRSITDALALWQDGFIAYRDPIRNLDYLRRASDIRDHGMYFELQGYQYTVLRHWRQLHASEEQPWDKLYDSLGGQGVFSLDDALFKLRLRPLHEALRSLLSVENLRELADAAQRVATLKESNQTEELAEPEGVDVVANAKEVATAKADPNPDSDAEDTDEEVSVPAKILSAAEQVCMLAEQHLASHRHRRAGSGQRAAFRDLLKLSLQLPALEQQFSDAWPAKVREVLPCTESAGMPECVWAPVLAWAFVSTLTDDPLAAFDRLDLRAALAEAFAAGMQGEDPWRAAARVRLLLAAAQDSVFETASSESFWQESDVRWLAGVNESDGVTWFNKESLEALLSWLELPQLLKENVNLEAIEAEMTQLREAADGAGYQLQEFLRKLTKTDVGTPEKAPKKADAETLTRS